MQNNGPIIIVDDDREDLELYKTVLKSLGVRNEILLFEEPSEFLKFMHKSNEKVFLILCDINMPQMDGFELRHELNLNPSLASKAIPFLFFSTSGNINHISKAYQSSIQGYFLKPSTLEEISKMFRCIVDYWDLSSHPTL